jgi:hypothetical protein
MSRSSMRRAAAAALCVALSALTAGCDDDAREFARQTAALLKQRSAELTRKIDAEVTAYGELATILGNAERTVTTTTLRNERNGRAIGMTADYAEGRRPVSRWQTDLLDYAQVDYTATRELLLAGIDANSRFLQGVQALEIEQAKVDTAAKLLESLEKKPSWKDEVVAVKDFAADVKKAVDERCAALQKVSVTDTVAAETFKNLHCSDK